MIRITLLGDITFLNILFKKLRRNEVSFNSHHDRSIDPEELRLSQENLKNGFRWVSKCQGEINYIRSSSTPIVYKALDCSTSQL
jgi:hypothetical protein